jgi:hypothetical protein
MQSPDNEDIRARVGECRAERVALIVTRMVSNERPADGNFHFGIVRPDELDHLIYGQVHDVEGGRDGDAERAGGQT